MELSTLRKQLKECYTNIQCTENRIIFIKGMIETYSQDIFYKLDKNKNGKISAIRFISLYLEKLSLV